MKNVEIRKAAKAAGVMLWEVAHELGMNDGNFSRKLRFELSENEQQQIMEIIQELGGQRNGVD